MAVGCCDVQENLGGGEGACTGLLSSEEESKEENESEFELQWAAAPKDGTDVCMRRLLVSKEVICPFCAKGLCNTPYTQ